MGGDTATAFARCAAEVSAAIRRSPAHWTYWAGSGDLARLGLIGPEADRSPAAQPAPKPTLLADGEFLHDDRADNVAARG
jgi:hypothetical protein